jgi:hypothetical protein
MNMTDQNKQYVISCIKNIYIEGSTNLWDGLHRCLQLTENSTHASPCVLLFTDGMPTVGDLQVDKAYQRYVNQTKNTKTHVYTFGFSNCVNSQLLNNISNIGNGQFHFISDSAMLFTTIINFMSNYLTMYGDIIVNGINYGQLYYGQSKYISYSNNVNELVIANIYGETIQVNEVEIINEEKFGIELYNTINMIEQLVSCRHFGELNSIFQNHMNSLNNDTNNQMVSSLIENLNDQVRLAISTQYYNTWGKHYLYSFLNAIKNQINNNFKDTLAQNFGGTQFYIFQDQLNNIVANVSPPPPSLTVNGNRYHVNSMNSFNDRSNPCFAGYNKVKMAYDDSFKYVKDIKKGDQVWTSMGTAQVTLVVKTICRNYMTDLCKVGNLVVTPWHPIKYNNEWSFPNELSSVSLVQCEAVYSFVLDKYHVMNIENFEVICLAHGYTNDILTHNFWGTQKIINDLKKKDGFESGLVVLQSGCLMTDPNTGLVCSL